MKVILSQEIKALGRKGEVKEVADGYARNYLIPKGLVIVANEANLRKMTEQKQSVKTRELNEEEEARAAAGRLQGLKVTIKAKSGESGRLFGSITAKDVAEAVMKTAQIELDRKKIDLEEGLKHLGHYDVTIKVYHGITATIGVEVVEGGD